MSGEFAAIIYSEPSAIGFVANAVCALVAAYLDFKHPQAGADGALLYAIPTYLLFGFLLQLGAGAACFRKNDRLGSTAFTVFALLWGALGCGALFDRHLLSAVPATYGFGSCRRPWRRLRWCTAPPFVCVACVLTLPCRLLPAPPACPTRAASEVQTLGLVAFVLVTVRLALMLSPVIFLSRG